MTVKNSSIKNKIPPWKRKEPWGRGCMCIFYTFGYINQTSLFHWVTTKVDRKYHGWKPTFDVIVNVCALKFFVLHQAFIVTF